MPAVKKILLALLAACLCVVIFPLPGFWPLAWVGLVPLFFAISDIRSGHAFFLGWLFGAVHSIGVGYWVFHALYFNSSAGLFASLSFMAVIIGGGIGLYFAVFCYGASRVMKTKMTLVLKTLLVACLWTGLEFCRAHLFSGIPWAFLGHSQYPWLSMIQIADITGVYGISFLIVLTNIAIFLALKISRNLPQAASLIFLPLILISSVLIYGSMRLPQYTPTGFITAADSAAAADSIAVVQISASQDEKWDTEKWPQILATLLELSENALKHGAAVVVWPETTVPFYLEQQIPDAVQQLFEKYHATLVTGGPRYTGTPGRYTYFNSVYQINSGSIVNIYNKIHLLPFGEYFPLGFIDVLKLRFSGPREYSSGKEPVIFTGPFGRFGALVCFEVLFPDFTRELVARGADFIVNVSNDAWFGKTSEHYQHFSMAVFRAVECRRPLVRSSNTGISGLIDAAGRMIHPIKPFDQGFQVYHPISSREITFYCKYGDLFAVFTLLSLFVAGVIRKIPVSNIRRQKPIRIPAES